MILHGKPNPKQAEFFRSTAKFTAYGGARGGGKSWALRRKLIALCLRYAGIHCLIIRRTLSELRQNHVMPLLAELGGRVAWSAGEREFTFANGSRITLGYLACDADTLRYQGQEYDIIAIDEATQLTEYQFSTLKGCLRGTGKFPRRMYLTCNPGGVGHAWVKRLFIDRDFREGENPSDYRFIQALVYDNDVLMDSDPDYVHSLQSLPDHLRAAWLEGRWDLFEGQFFPEFSKERHVCAPVELKSRRRFAAFDYGFDRFALLFCCMEGDMLYVYREFCKSGLTLSQAAGELARLCDADRQRGFDIAYAVASPDLWNRRQDSGYSGQEIMSRTEGVPPLLRADNRRIPGWRALRETLDGHLRIFEGCRELISSMQALLCDPAIPEDASGEPHAVTHAPEALRYAVMSRSGDRCDVRVDRTIGGLANF
ncbi:MAG: phage terminase large subunit [Clostridia bacterium]|nr:phage terminase large subunit [Clostridia bacterium]